MGEVVLTRTGGINVGKGMFGVLFKGTESDWF